MSVVGLIAAGGTGERLGGPGPKAFVVLAGRPMLEWSLDVLREVCDRVMVAVPEGHEDGIDRLVGGRSRSASVRNALRAAPEATAVVVHDAARPLVTADLVRQCLDCLPGADGAVAAAPVTDTIKEAGPDRIVRATLERASLWAIQTPQAFQPHVLRRALDTTEAELAAATDDSTLVERDGGVIRLVEAPPENLKVTSAFDFEIAERLLDAR